jgi:hypothetical protein
MPLHTLSPRLFNPFVNATPEPGLLEWIKIILLFPTLGLVRVVLMAALLLFFSIVCGVLTLGATSARPLPLWRRVPIEFFALLIARLFLFILGFYWVPITGRKASARVSNAAGPFLTSQEAPIIVSNHVSYIEPIFFTGQGCSHVAKAAIGNLPLFGLIAKGIQMCFVDRAGKASCAAAKGRIQERCAFASVLFICQWCLNCHTYCIKAIFPTIDGP